MVAEVLEAEVGDGSDEHVEEAPERREGEALVRDGGGQLVDEAGGDPRGDVGQVYGVVVVAPGQETVDPAGVGKPGVRVAEPGGDGHGKVRHAPTIVLFVEGA
ncbi:MAG: hypothetical protein OXU64_06505 [Gemmatimonadota bacterium]|nr:hypothetical protein [Gemmatimonadota bacterium]